MTREKISRSSKRDEIVKVCCNRREKALIDLAAASLGRSRSEFMLEASCRDAESVLRDRRYFVLQEHVFRQFPAVLDRPPKNNPKLRRLLETRAPWDR